ncbi:MAG: MFS transporter, partial [Phycisphaerae bacterium]|nr:MFS transporter [Phycisphaerae bacterium]
PSGYDGAATDAEALAYAELPPETAEVLEYETTRGLWSVGTLTYTTGALVSLFFYLLVGDFGLQMRERGVAPVVQKMLTNMHASNKLMAILLSTLPTGLSLIIGPVVSFKSDRLRSKWGRRIPYLLIPTPLVAVAILVFTYSEEIGKWLAHLTGAAANTCSLTVFGLGWTAFECFAIVATSLIGGLVNDVVPRPVLGRFYGLFRAVSLIAGILFFVWGFKLADAHYRAILTGIAIIFFFGFMVMCLKVREGEYPPVEEMDPTVDRRLGSVLLYFKESFRDPYYLWIFAAFALTAAAFIPVNLFSIPFAARVHMKDSVYGELIGLTYFISLILSWPLGWLVDRFKPLTVATAAMVIYAVIVTPSGLFVHDARSFGTVLVVHGVLSGCYFTTSSPLGQVLYPRMKYGQFASAGGLILALFTMALGPALGLALDIVDKHKLMADNYNLTLYLGGFVAFLSVVTLVIVWVLHSRRPEEVE